MAQTQTTIRLEESLLREFKDAVQASRFASMTSVIETLIKSWLAERKTLVGNLETEGHRRDELTEGRVVQSTAFSPTLTSRDWNLIQRLLRRMDDLVLETGSGSLSPLVSLAFLERFPEVVVVKDDQGRMLWANEEWTKVMGKSWRQYEGKLASEIWISPYGDEILKHDLEVVRRREARFYTEAVPTEGENIIRIRTSLRFPITRKPDQKVVRIGVVAHEAEAALDAYDEWQNQEIKKSMSPMSSLCESFIRWLPVPVRIVREDGSLLFANDGERSRSYQLAEEAKQALNRLADQPEAPLITDRPNGELQLWFSLQRRQDRKRLFACVGLDSQKIQDAARLMDCVEAGEQAYVDWKPQFCGDETTLQGTAPHLCRQLLELIPVVVTIKKGDGRIIWANKAYELLSRKKLEDVIGRFPLDHWPKIGARVRDLDELVRLYRRPIMSVERIPLPDGLLKRLTIRFPIFGDRGELMTGSLGFDYEEIVRRASWGKDVRDQPNYIPYTAYDVTLLKEFGISNVSGTKATSSRGTVSSETPRARRKPE